MNTDNVLFGILILGIILLFGFGTNYLIDKKLSDININIPRINVPEPQIIVNVVKKRKYHENRDNKEEHKNNNNKMENVEGFDPDVPYISNEVVKDPSKLPEAGRSFLPYIWENEVEEEPQKLEVKELPIYSGRVIGCQRNSKRLLFPDQVPKEKANNRTGENFFKYYFTYPTIPALDQDRWLPYNIGDKEGGYINQEYSPPDRNYRVIPRHYSSVANRAPFPSNYYFTFAKR